MNSPDSPVIVVQALTEQGFSPYGAMLGTPVGSRQPSFSNDLTDFWHQHLFNPGKGGHVEVLWVNYRNNVNKFSSLELHRHTQQVIVPVSGPGVVHVVALPSSNATDLEPNLHTLQAFWVPMGQGVCMNPLCWHATFVAQAQVTCLMLTRSSTTSDLVQALQNETQPTESLIHRIAQHAFSIPQGLLP